MPPAALYLLPLIVALSRKVPNVGSIVIINIFLGWTFIGWIVALAMAFRDRTTSQVAIHNHYSSATPPPPPSGPSQ